MNILVCGTREELTRDQRIVVRRVLLTEDDGPHVVIDGQAAGVDAYAHKCALDAGWGTRQFPADWQRFGKRAGPIRNQQMLDESAAMGYPVELVLAFPLKDLPSDKRSGTWDMVTRAVKNRIPVRVYPI